MSELDDTLETFEEDGFEDVAEVEAVAEVGTKRQKKVKPAKPARVNKPVTVKEISAETLLFPPDVFELTLSSVSGRDFTFEDPATALSWITRREYNGEAISPNVETAHQMLGSIRYLSTLDRRLQELGSRGGEEINFEHDAAWNVYKRLSDKAQEALNNVPANAATTVHRSNVQAVLDYVKSVLDTPVNYSEEVTSPAHIETDENGQEIQIEAVVKRTADVSARAEAAAEITNRVADLRQQRLYLKDFLSPDATS